MGMIFNKNLLFKKIKAFSLVELIVIISIFSIIAGVAMFNFQGFRSRVALEQLAYDVGLSLQQLQQRTASGVSGSSAISNATPPVGFYQGIQFTWTGGTPGPGSFSNEFIMFRDDKITDDKTYNIANDTLIDRVKIQYNEYIEKIETDSDATFLSTSSNYVNITNKDISVMFKRPWLESYFFDLSSGSGVLMNNNQVQYMRITLASGTGSNIIRKYIIISSAGQINVK